MGHAVQVLGEDHPSTLTVRGNRASWRGQTGDAAGAAQEYADILDHMVRMVGEDDPRTPSVRTHLASWRREGGRTQDVG
ncbi:hypothetical protein QFZ56_000063 [Streptomyces achromogenes]|uniref:Tetratricopeptide repeat protein n=1 Tax=Streptomyces achromogenes TaxID=67255 RepID=A0ABU0PRW5_STRAH|nr:hypothetical protein [Streptomyces achromogenes]MDQ0681100.1 hypothetical protein [Streptomyces achromogenes]